MQNEITKPQKLLNQNGELNTRGWARDLILEYNKYDIKAAKHRIKEWDYYIVSNDHCAIALTIADNGYMGMVSASLMDFDKVFQHTKSVTKLFPMGRMSLPMSSKSGDTTFTEQRLGMKFSKTAKKRFLKCEFLNFYEGKNLYVNLTLEEPEQDSMVIATPFKKDKKAFYYNQKINCMPASGIVRCGGDEYAFSPEDSFGTLDWGRGVWTYKNTWYWGSASGLLNQVPFGFNIGYGFGDTSAATENVLFYNGTAHKLDEVTFHIPKNDYLKPWVFSSNDKRFEMDFVPIIDRSTKTSLGVLSSNQHQVFGRFSGRVILDSGKELSIKDLTGFAEKVINKW